MSKRSKIVVLFSSFLVAIIFGTLVELNYNLASAETTYYIAPETVKARVYGLTLVDGKLYGSCRLDAGYGKTLFLLRCGVNRLDEHWYGDSVHPMWQNVTYAVVEHQKVIIGTHGGFACQHGKKYSLWASGESTGVIGVARSSAKTSYRSYC